MEDYLTTDELATWLRTSPETVRYWRHIGKGPASFQDRPAGAVRAG